ncbi:DUF4199 domain-containing protein [Salegentibacter sp. UBA1130]|uniref:DUF4199 domain-containing protein n=1 Tax=Salegentibacter sp. UBA1130 TaxID=1947451 RepID=UPI00257ACD41|nr:DUF4199 domain-containing protein [Salegentibacter sp. UBA1130]
MENSTKVSPGKFGANYGLVLGIILVLISIIMYVTGMALEGKQWPMYIFYFIFLIVIVLAIKGYKKNNANYLSLSEALKTGVSAAVISGLIYLVYNILFNYVIEPNFAEDMIDVARDNMNEMGNLTDEQIEMSLQWIKWVSNPFLGGAIWLGFSAFFGLIYSLIAGLIMKNKNPQDV